MRFNFLLLVLLGNACTSAAPPLVDGGSTGACAAAPTAMKSDYCNACVPVMGVTCTEAKPVKACCVYTQQPRQPLARAMGLVYNSAPNNDPTIDFSCLDAPKPVGQRQNVTLTGYVKLFSSGDDSAGVKIEIFEEAPAHDGSLGPLVGAGVITSSMDAFLTPKPNLLSHCPQPDGCAFRSFTYPNVPTETPLVIKTSDAASAQKWAELYDYNIFFSNGSVQSGDAGPATVYYEPSAVAATDLNTVAQVAGGFVIKADRGLLAGEVHDCADVRLSHAMVNTDVKPEGDLFYFTETEANPLPDKSRTPAGQGTSSLGLFGGLNYPTGQPVRISATGLYQGQIVLVGTYTVRVFPGAVTALSLRGRRPWQK